MKSRTLFAARSLQTKRPEISADNSLQNKQARRSSRVSGRSKRNYAFLLCEASVFSVSPWLISPQRHKEHRGYTEKQKWRSYDERRETHDEGDRGYCDCGDAGCGGSSTHDHGAVHRDVLRYLALCSSRAVA